jgi:hypothetical protein
MRKATASVRAQSIAALTKLRELAASGKHDSKAVSYPIWANLTDGMMRRSP